MNYMKQPNNCARLRAYAHVRGGKFAGRVLFILLALFLSVDAGRVAASDLVFAGEEIEITAGHAEFDPETQVFTGSDGVEITSGGLVIRGREVIFDQEGLLKATGEVEFIYPSLFLQGEDLLYNFTTETGEITEFTGNMEGTLFRGSRAEIIGRSLYLEDTAFTRCTLSEPDLEFCVRSIRMDNDRLETGAGWLKVKGIRLLPLPPLSVPTKSPEGWPLIGVGYDNDWSLFFSGSVRYPFFDQFAFSTGAILGINGRLGLTAGLYWFPDELLEMNTSYTWNNRAGEEIIYSLKHKGIRSEFQAGITNNREEGEIPGQGWMQLHFPLAPKVTGELFLRKDYPYEITGLTGLDDPKVESFGGRVRKNWSPQFSAGLGLVHARGDWGEWEKDYLPGWQLETAVEGRILQVGPWTLGLEAIYMWGKEEGLWNTQKVALFRDLHCFEAGLNYDLLKKEIALEINLTW